MKVDGISCVCNRPDAGYPIIFLLEGAGRHAVDRVLALDHFALRVRLAS